MTDETKKETSKRTTKPNPVFERGNVRIVVKRKHGEWCASVSINGRYSEDASYYTPDKQDALDTAQMMLDHMIPEEPKSEPAPKMIDANKLTAWLDAEMEAFTLKANICSDERDHALLLVHLGALRKVKQQVNAQIKESEPDPEFVPGWDLKLF